MSNKITKIKTAAGNVITNISSSGYFYAPYVPLQTTYMTSPSKTLVNVELRCNTGLETTYQFAVGKSYEFVMNYMKSAKMDETELTEFGIIATDFSQEEYHNAIRRYVHEFQIYERMFVSKIEEICNNFYYMSEHSKNKNDDYAITLVSVSREQAFSFTGTEIIDLLDRQIIKELV